MVFLTILASRFSAIPSTLFLHSPRLLLVHVLNFTGANLPEEFRSKSVRPAVDLSSFISVLKRFGGGGRFFYKFSPCPLSIHFLISPDSVSRRRPDIASEPLLRDFWHMRYRSLR